MNTAVRFRFLKRLTQGILWGLVLCLLAPRDTAADSPAGESDRVATEATELQAIDVGFPLASLAYSPDGKRLAASGLSGFVHLYSTEKHELGRVLQIPFPQENIDKQEAIQHCDHVVFSPDGRRLAGLFNGEWDFVRGPDNQRVNFYGLTRGIVIWNPANGKIDKTIELGRRLGMVPEGTKKAQGAGAAGALDDGLTREEGVRSIAFAQSGKRVIGDRGYMWLVDADADGALNKGDDPVVFVAAAGEEDRRVTVSPRGVVQFWDRRGKFVTQAKAKAQVTRKGKTSLRSIAISADGAMLAIGATDGVRLFDVAKGKPLKGIRTGKKKPGPVLSVAFTRDAGLLATAHQSGTVKIWNPATRDELRDLSPEKPEKGKQQPARAVAFSPDGTRLAIARGPRIEFVDVSALKIE